MKVQFLQPTITEDDIAEVNRVLRGGWLVLQQDTVDFEKEFAAYMGTKEAVLMNSCTCAIHISLMMLGLKEGDEVIVPALTYVSSINPVLHCGATPVFVDVDEDTGLINLDAVEKAITGKTKAIIPVHIYGQMVDMKRLRDICAPHNIQIVEDAAHAIEAERDGIKPGAEGVTATFSFHVAKNITAGTGGALITNDEKLADRARILRRDGVRNVGSARYMEELGHKYLAADFQAALLRSQLRRIDDQWSERQAHYNRYADALTTMGVPFNRVLPNSRHAYHMIVIWVDPAKRDEIRDKLYDDGIQTSIHYNPVTLEPYYQQKFGFKKGDFPVSEKLGFSTITLPMYSTLTEEQQDYVIEKVKEYV